jgi:hypothetical protein
MGRQNRTMGILGLSHPIPWDSKNKNFPSHPMGFLILQQNSIEDRTYFFIPNSLSYSFICFRFCQTASRVV